KAVLSDARNATRLFPKHKKRVKLVLTSPPYLDVTNYEEDQWLRLWFLGNPARPTYGVISKDDRYSNAERYWQFLTEVWIGLRQLTNTRAYLVCRIGARGISQDTLKHEFLRSLKVAFPKARLSRSPVVSRIRNRQTEVFRPGSKGCLYETDFFVRLKNK